MFEYIKKIITKIKDSHEKVKLEIELYNKDLDFYSDTKFDNMYDHRPIQIFHNGSNIYTDNPRSILVNGCGYFAGCNYLQISFIKLCIFYTLIEPEGNGVEVDINGDRWKIILSRNYFKEILKTR